MIKAEIVAHSLSPQGDELISVLCTFPRIILAEVNTHRMLSKNTSSSRAIPFKKMVESVQNNPFIPIAWQKHHSGMQGSEYYNKELVKDLKLHNWHYESETTVVEQLKVEWLQARDEAIIQATYLNELGLTKQLCNRLLEPFMWTTMLITGSREGWDNFFNLRCPQYELNEGVNFKSKKDLINHYHNIDFSDKNNLWWLQINKGQAEIHIMDLAEKIYDAMNESTPKQLQAGEWHIPFEDNIHLDNKGTNIHDEAYGMTLRMFLEAMPSLSKIKGAPVDVKISTAMAARTSYTVVGEEKEIDYKKMIELHDRLLSQDPPHSSPLEHCARAMSDEEYYSFIKGKVKTGHIDESEHQIFLSNKSHNWGDYSELGWCNNLKGFIPYRYFIDNKIEI